MNIAVFCSSSNALEQSYYILARQFGKLLAEQKHNLVFGGANVGMMKALAESAKSAGAALIGVIPEFFDQKGLTCDQLDQVFYVRSMAERKEKIISLSDAFVALPGGFGTLDELLEVIVLKQIAQIDSPIVILNYNGFFDSLLQQFDLFFQTNFAKPRFRDIYFTAQTPAQVFEYLKNYRPITDDQWYKVEREHFEDK